MTRAPSPLRAWTGGVLVLVLAAIVYLPNLSTPSGAIWDESYYLTAIDRQVEHRAQFASHPPLGFMLLGEAATRAGYQPDHAAALGAGKTVTGDAIPDGFPFWRVRIGSALAGMGGALAFYALMIVLTSGRVLPSLLLSNLFVFETGFVVQFSAAQLDSFLLLFVVLALLGLAIADRRQATGWRGEALFGVALALAACVKVVGLVLAIGGPLLLVARWFSSPTDRRVFWLRAATTSVLMSVSFLAAMAVVFTVNTATQTQAPDTATSAGVRDAAFINPIYAAWLDGRRAFGPSVVLDAAQSSLTYISEDMASVPLEDANGSNPLLWPLGLGAIQYRWDDDGDRRAHLGLIMNPVGTAVALIGLALGAWTVFDGRDQGRRSLAMIFAGLWLVILIAHLVIGLGRVVYLYHYFPALICAWALLPIGLAELADRCRAPHREPILAALAALHLAAFAALSPFAYGAPLTARACEARDFHGRLCS